MQGRRVRREKSGMGFMMCAMCGVMCVGMPEMEMDRTLLRL